jgi:hypothetical protein
MNPITAPDVINVAESIKKAVTSEMISEVIKRYPFAQKQDPTANWSLVVEQLVYEVYYEFGKLERDKEELIDKVVDQMEKDINSQDQTAICELLRFVPIEYLKGYLAED